MNFTLSNFEIKLDKPESTIDIAHALAFIGVDWHWLAFCAKFFADLGAKSAKIPAELAAY